MTTTSARGGTFDSRFFHLVFEEEFGRVKGHFGPINSVAFHPDGKGSVVVWCGVVWCGVVWCGVVLCGVV